MLAKGVSKLFSFGPEPLPIAGGYVELYHDLDQMNLPALTSSIESQSNNVGDRGLCACSRLARQDEKTAETHLPRGGIPVVNK